MGITECEEINQEDENQDSQFFRTVDEKNKGGMEMDESEYYAYTIFIINIDISICLRQEGCWQRICLNH